MSKVTKYLIGLGVIFLIGVVFYNKVYIPKTTYEKISPTKGSLDVEVFGIGNVGAKNIYVINSQTGGKILQIFTDEGKWVKEGDLLVSIDSVDMPQLLEEAKISVQKAKAELIASQKELDSLGAQKNLAQVTYDRYAKLKAQSFASQSEYDKAKADLKAITAQMAVTRAHIESAKTEIKRAQKAVEALEVKLSRYKIYAPVDGYVIKKYVEPAQSVTLSAPILEIVDPKTVWIKAYIDERISGDVKVGQRAKIKLRSQDTKQFDGYVKRIVAQSDAVTGEREVDVAFETLPIPFYINEQAEVKIATQYFRDVVKIPAKLLIHKDDKSGVWIENDSIAHFKSLKVLGIGTNEAAVEGVDIYTKLLIVGEKNKALKEGMRVH
ncbi:efflux RND transporter periplasmic adaptor subunit [Sulfurimonas sp.]